MRSNLGLNVTFYIPVLLPFFKESDSYQSLFPAFDTNTHLTVVRCWHGTILIDIIYSNNCSVTSLQCSTASFILFVHTPSSTLSLLLAWVKKMSGSGLVAMALHSSWIWLNCLESESLHLNVTYRWKWRFHSISFTYCLCHSSCGEDMEASDGEPEDETTRPAKVNKNKKQSPFIPK